MIRLGSLAALDDRPAVIEPGRGQVSYAELDGVAAKLCALGVEPGSHVGLYLRRSTDAIALMLGTLRAGCTYVPVDPGAPLARNAEILSDCAVRVTIAEQSFAAAHREALRAAGAAIDVQSIGEIGLGRAVREWTLDRGSFDAGLR